MTNENEDLINYVIDTANQYRNGGVPFLEFVQLMQDITESQMSHSLPWTAILAMNAKSATQFAPAVRQWCDLLHSTLTSDVESAIIEACLKNIRAFASPADPANSAAAAGGQHSG